jgi:ABC-type multidrug transport system permease subunit
MKHFILYSAIIAALAMAAIGTYQWTNDHLSTHSYIIVMVMVATSLINSINYVRLLNYWKPIDWSKQ